MNLTNNGHYIFEDFPHISKNKAGGTGYKMDKQKRAKARKKRNRK